MHCCETISAFLRGAVWRRGLLIYSYSVGFSSGGLMHSQHNISFKWQKNKHGRLRQIGTITGCHCQVNLLPVCLPEWGGSLDQHWNLDSAGCIIKRQAEKDERKQVGSCPLPRSPWGGSAVAPPSETDWDAFRARRQHLRSLNIHTWSFFTLCEMEERGVPDLYPQQIQLELELSSRQMSTKCSTKVLVQIQSGRDWQWETTRK